MTEEADRMRDPEAWAKKVNQTYWLLGNKLFDGESINWFIFAAYGTAEVVRAVAATKDDLPEVADAFVSGMSNMFFHVIKDPAKVAVEVEETAYREQTLLQPYLEQAMGEYDPVWLTGEMKVTFPNCTHWASDRVLGTKGEWGAPVLNWLVFDQRWKWMWEIMRLHMHDLSLLEKNPGAEWAAEVEVLAPGSPWGV